MSAGRLWARATELFDRALELAEGERADFVVAASEGDEALRDRVLAMLRADAGETPVLDGTPFDLAAAVAFRAAPVEGRRVGPYVVTGLLGRGGMGTVCLARREDVGKQVALKLVAGGWVSADRLARFMRERRVLARLEHPDIVPLVDAGIADDGTPWFAMEYVAGEPLDVYCARLALSTERRLRLFERIASAVGYAHQHLVVHRDLKPANILVEPDDEPRLLDFGIAKLLTPADTDDDEATVTGVRPLTPACASPEQLRGDPITTASDVYQLGLLLKGLLTGARGASADGRPDEARVGAPPLARDLQVIVEKATRDDPRDRYRTAEQLGLDVGRFRRGLPIEARPATLRYRLGKLIVRHKLGALTTATGFATTVAFLVAMGVQRRQVEAERERAERVSALLTDLFSAADPLRARGEEITVQAVLDAGLERVRGGLTADPEVKARLLSVIGQTYFGLGQPRRAAEVQSEVVATLRTAVGERDPALARALGTLSGWLADTDARERAYPPGQEAVALARAMTRQHGAELADALSKLGYAHQRAGDARGALQLDEEALAIYRELPEQEADGLESLLVNLGYLASNRGDAPAATAYFREVLERRRERLGPDRPETIRVALALAALLPAEDPEEAERIARNAVTEQRRIFVRPHGDLVHGLSTLARILDARGAFAEAEATQREALDLAIAVYGDSSSVVALEVADLAGYVQHEGRLDDAAALHAEALRRYRAQDGAASLSAAVVETNLARTEFARGRLAEAETMYRQALPVLASAWAGTPPFASILVDFSQVLSARGRCEEAESPLRDALDVLAARPAGDVLSIRAQRVLGGCLLELGRYEAAEPLLVAAHQALAAQWGDDNPYTVQAADDLRRLRLKWDRPVEVGR